MSAANRADGLGASSDERRRILSVVSSRRKMSTTDIGAEPLLFLFFFSTVPLHTYTYIYIYTENYTRFSHGRVCGCMRVRARRPRRLAGFMAAPND